MTETSAKILSMALLLIALLLACKAVLIDKKLVSSFILISASFAFAFAYRNPAMLMAQSWKEFGERYDAAQNKELLWGNPAFYMAILFVGVYVMLT